MVQKCTGVPHAQEVLTRCLPDSIREFRASARRRYDDGLTAVTGGRGLAAIYLWGYCAEMLLKAAYFSVVGVGDATYLQMAAHINPAIQHGQLLGIAWPPGGKGHNVRAWAELLVLERALHANPAMAYAPDFANRVQSAGQRIGELWNETLRYHKNSPYSYEIRQVREATEWLLVNVELL